MGFENLFPAHIQDDREMRAPSEQIILYPQYPEIRLSGFLLGTRNAPSTIMASRDAGRVLFLGTTPFGEIIAWACSAGSQLERELHSLENLEQTGAFFKVPLGSNKELPPRERLIRELGRIHQLDWITSKSLTSDGSFVACNSSQCVGYTLEAELGVPRNGFAEPDFHGWEVKAGQVDSFAQSSASKAVTLMTPEPTGGFYRTDGVEAFLRRFGYADRKGREDRINFGGIYRAGVRTDVTGLTLKLQGYDHARHELVETNGSLALVSDDGIVAAECSFTTLATLWNRKHAQAVYVPAECRTDPAREYRYGGRVRLGEGTDFLRLLAAIADGVVHYDPAVKLETGFQLKARAEATQPVPDQARRSCGALRWYDRG
ncbi:MAG TPA: MvaI/BcnI family restriction endonuclease [Devosia sp.]|uniref:MvaI/BcnI family restriction endonuclease n=1 Tax=Devosia sp. TaxID=1871048 RepID=UPI002DDD152D|nr:MvaI/BcnI family restriction endonuclease [Devosia sp.]HEV2515418.1 MvaI/BcnI family restriction endonuclease [Devosia sp.]